jgi:hypothetical protein
MDDVMIFSPDLDAHLVDLDHALKALEEAGFKICLDKSEFCMEEMAFLGHIVTKDGLRPDPAKVVAVREAPIPQTLTQVRAFLGLSSYYRRFIFSFSEVATPLNRLLCKDVKLIWTKECQEAFDRLKDALTSAPILVRPDFDQIFILQTDWQPNSVAAILCQKDENNRDRVIEYASSSLSPAQRKYAATEGECYAVIWAVKHFRPYLYGHPFLLQTDHQALQYMPTMKDPTGKIARWIMTLQQFHYKPQYRPGTSHTNVDGLTRLLPPPNPKPSEIIRKEKEKEEEEEEDPTLPSTSLVIRRRRKRKPSSFPLPHVRMVCSSFPLRTTGEFSSSFPLPPAPASDLTGDRHIPKRKNRQRVRAPRSVPQNSEFVPAWADWNASGEENPQQIAYNIINRAEEELELREMHAQLRPSLTESLSPSTPPPRCVPPSLLESVFSQHLALFPQNVGHRSYLPPFHASECRSLFPLSSYRESLRE